MGEDKTYYRYILIEIEYYGEQSEEFCEPYSFLKDAKTKMRGSYREFIGDGNGIVECDISERSAFARTEHGRFIEWFIE